MRSNTRYLFLIAASLVLFSLIDALSVSNLSGSCLQCLCYAASNCTLNIKAGGGYVGPFWIAGVYWLDSGNHTLPGDDPGRDNAYPDCTKKYECASMVVTKYMQRYGKDCDKNGITDCDDFARIHFLGPDCGPNPTEDFDITYNFFKRYLHCRKTALEANPLL